jgi:hypothetical protein
VRENVELSPWLGSGGCSSGDRLCASHDRLPAVSRAAAARCNTNPRFRRRRLLTTPPATAGALVLYVFYLPHFNAAVALPAADEVDRLLRDPAALQ